MPQTTTISLNAHLMETCGSSIADRFDFQTWRVNVRSCDGKWFSWTPFLTNGEGND
jgi:hypothetical protein